MTRWKLGWILDGSWVDFWWILGPSWEVSWGQVGTKIRKNSISSIQPSVLPNMLSSRLADPADINRNYDRVGRSFYGKCLRKD